MVVLLGSHSQLMTIIMALCRPTHPSAICSHSQRAEVQQRGCKRRRTANPAISHVSRCSLVSFTGDWRSCAHVCWRWQSAFSSIYSPPSYITIWCSFAVYYTNIVFNLYNCSFPYLSRVFLPLSYLMISPVFVQPVAEGCCQKLSLGNWGCFKGHLPSPSVQPTGSPSNWDYGLKCTPKRMCAWTAVSTTEKFCLYSFLHFPERCIPHVQTYSLVLSQHMHRI